MTQFLQDFVDKRDAVEGLKAATKAKLETERTQAASNDAVIHAFTTLVRGMFGTSADALADFGLTPPKAPTPPTAEKKAAAVAKRAATREARHTKGKVQKKSVKGAVTATLVVTPLSAPLFRVVTAPPVLGTCASAAPHAVPNLPVFPPSSESPILRRRTIATVQDSCVMTLEVPARRHTMLHAVP